MLPGLLLFLLGMSINTIVSEFPIRLFSIEMDLFCPGARTVCVFIEVFEDEVVYEQLLTRFESCLEYKSTSFHVMDPFFHLHNDPFRITLPEIPVGRLLDNDTFTANFEITHDCSSLNSTRVMCIRGAALYDGYITRGRFEQTLKDVGEPGACSSRWAGSELWTKYVDKVDELEEEEEMRTDNGTLILE